MKKAATSVFGVAMLVDQPVDLPRVVDLAEPHRHADGLAARGAHGHPRTGAAARGVIADVLGKDSRLAPLLRAHGPVRVPGAWDGFELAMRAVLGQQVTVAGARTLAGRLIERAGVLRPEAIVGADLTAFGVPSKRADTLQTLARRVLDGKLNLDPWSDAQSAREELLSIPGIGPWTVEYIAMRALRDPDAFPASDVGIRKALGKNGAPCSAKDAERWAEAWRPWRSYAVMLLWRSL